MLQLYARCQCLPENGSCRWKVVVVVVSRQRLVTETWKALTWSTNRHSSASHAQTRLPHLNHTSVGGECACLCVSAWVYHLNVLPFIDLKTRGFCAPVKPHVEVAVRFIRSLHLSTVPPFFFSLPISPLWWCDISLLGHQISQSHLGDTSLTSWLLYLLNWEKFPLI